jgi:excisionase family DNA binding protein
MKKKRSKGVKLSLNPFSDDPLLTSEEVCQILRITDKTLYRLRFDKRLNAIRVNTRRYVYRTSAVRRYLEMAEAGEFAPQAVTVR